MMPLSVKTYISNQEIFDSGAIVIRDLSPVRLTLQSHDDNDPYEVIINFLQNDQQESGVSWTSLLSKRGTEITFTNFDSSSGLTLHYPIPIGFFQGKPLLLDVVIYTLGDDPKAKPPKLFCYTLRAGA
jgi:hypothetical protein